MCGRYYVEISQDEFSNLKNIENFTFETNYNIPPQSEVPVIINNSIQLSMWGYLPDWLKQQKNSRPLFNTRFETVLEKKTFKSAFQNSRCLIPISGWYEWKNENDAKQPYFFKSNKNKVMLAAGLYWNMTDGRREVSIITREAQTPLNEIHHRTPFILNSETESLWSSDINPDELYSTLSNQEYESIEFYKVNKAVNNPSNNNPSLIEEFEEVPF